MHYIIMYVRTAPAAAIRKKHLAPPCGADKNAARGTFRTRRVKRVYRTGVTRPWSGLCP